MLNKFMLFFYFLGISLVTCIKVANYGKLSSLNSHCNRYTTCEECQSSIDCQIVEIGCYEFCQNYNNQQNQIKMHSGIVDKIDNMEEMETDMKTDNTVRQLKANPTMGIGPNNEDPPIESEIFSTPQQKCLDSLVCRKCAEMMSCEITVDQKCFSNCLA